MRVETIAEQLYFTTVRLMSCSGGARSVGTGFVYNVPTDKGAVHILVSNKHVLDEALEELVVAMIGSGSDEQPAYGTGVFSDASQLLSSVVRHPADEVDIAGLPFGPVVQSFAGGNGAPFYRAIPPELGLSDENIGDLDAVEDHRRDRARRDLLTGRMRPATAFRLYRLIRRGQSLSSPRPFQALPFATCPRGPSPV